MLRDGQYLPEKPIKIGAHYARQQKHEPNETEVFMQSVLLGHRLPKPRTRYDVIAVIVGCYAACAVLVGLVKGWDAIFGG